MSIGLQISLPLFFATKSYLYISYLSTVDQDEEYISQSVTHTKYSATLIPSLQCDDVCI